MRFVYTLTIPAGTTQADPVEQSARLTKGRLVHAEIAIPPGPANLAHVVVRDALFQILPVNPESSFAWDDYTHLIDLDYDLPMDGHTLTLVGWNDDDTFEHTIEFRFDVTPSGTMDERALIEQLVMGAALPGRA